MHVELRSKLRKKYFKQAPKRSRKNFPNMYMCHSVAHLSKSKLIYIGVWYWTAQIMINLWTVRATEFISDQNFSGIVSGKYSENSMCCNKIYHDILLWIEREDATEHQFLESNSNLFRHVLLVSFGKNIRLTTMGNRTWTRWNKVFGSY